MNKILQDYFTASLIYSELYRRLQEQVKSYGVTPQQAIILACIENESITCSELAETMKISLPTVTILTKPLESNKFLLKLKGEHNKKYRRLEITDKGRAVLAGI